MEAFALHALFNNTKDDSIMFHVDRVARGDRDNRDIGFDGSSCVVAGEKGRAKRCLREQSQANRSYVAELRERV